MCSRGLGDKEKPARKPRGLLINRHDYISVIGSILSFQAGDGGMIASQGSLDDNEHGTNPKCETLCADDSFDKYVLDAANEVGAPLYCIWAFPGSRAYRKGFRNCQSWARDVIKLAKKNYLESESCPTCFVQSKGMQDAMEILSRRQ